MASQLGLHVGYHTGTVANWMYVVRLRHNCVYITGSFVCIRSLSPGVRRAAPPWMCPLPPASQCSRSMQWQWCGNGMPAETHGREGTGGRSHELTLSAVGVSTEMISG